VCGSSNDRRGYLIDGRLDPNPGLRAKLLVSCLAREDYPSDVYQSAEVELAFEFIPRRKPTPSMASESIVAFGPAMAWYSQAVPRLRHTLSKKVGSRYDLRDRPYAVLVSARDYSCGIEDIFNALYGDAAISFPAGDPDSAQPFRRNNGSFGASASTPEGRVRRLSCVFALMRDWIPGSAETPTLIRFDNPFAKLAFPDDVFSLTSWFVAHRNESGVRMEWEPSSPSW
jgi:hypothetical protein